MQTNPNTPLVLLSGLAADARIFTPQKIAFPQLCCPRWLIPNGLACQFRDSDSRVFKWSLSRILDWKSTPIVPCPVYHLHGDRDWTLPLQSTDPDMVVEGGGHVLSLTHPSDVNAFIRDVLSKTVSSPPCKPENR